MIFICFLFHISFNLISKHFLYQNSTSHFEHQQVNVFDLVQALASSVQCPVSSLWRVPDHWTLDEAATVPLAYAKAYHSLVIVAGLQKGKKVFIHAGTSPVGQVRPIDKSLEMSNSGLQSEFR